MRLRGRARHRAGRTSPSARCRRAARGGGVRAHDRGGRDRGRRSTSVGLPFPRRAGEAPHDVPTRERRAPRDGCTRCRRGRTALRAGAGHHQAARLAARPEKAQPPSRFSSRARIPGARGAAAEGLRPLPRPADDGGGAAGAADRGSSCPTVHSHPRDATAAAMARRCTYSLCRGEGDESSVRRGSAIARPIARFVGRRSSRNPQSSKARARRTSCIVPAP